MLVLYRSRGLVKEWQDRSGNLLLQEFSLLTPNVGIVQEQEQDRSGNLVLQVFSLLTPNVGIVQEQGTGQGMAGEIWQSSAAKV